MTTEKQIAWLECELGVVARYLVQLQEFFMAQLIDLKTKADAQGAALDALAKTVAGLPPAGTLSAADQAVVDSVAAELDANTAKIAQAQAALAGLTPTPPPS